MKIFGLSQVEMTFMAIPVIIGIIFLVLTVKKASEKGYEMWIGVVIGLFLWLPGYAIVCALPDKRKM